MSMGLISLVECSITRLPEKILHLVSNFFILLRNKAVYIDKRDLKCACVGGDTNTNLPLGLLTLTENTLMVFAGVWMLV